MSKYKKIYDEVKRIMESPPESFEPRELDFSARIGHGVWFDRVSQFKEKPDIYRGVEETTK